MPGLVPGIHAFLAAAKQDVDARLKAGHDELLLIAIIRLDRAVDLDGQRVAVAVLGVAGGGAHPTLADAIFLDIGFFDALEANADIAGQHGLVVIKALRIVRQTVGQWVRRWIGRSAVLGVVVLVHSRASISFFSPSGVVVGACRATTLPDRSTRNLVKFHLIDGPSSPDFSLFRY